MTNTSDINATVEFASLAENVSMGAVNATVLCLAIVAYVLMGKTTKVPGPAKLLSQTLLVIFCIMLMASTGRRLVTSPVVNLQMALIVACSRHLTCVVLILMSVDRYICICRPYLYGRLILRNYIKKCIAVGLAATASLFYILRLGYCSALRGVHNVFTSPLACNPLMVPFYLMSYGVTTVICLVCYIKVYKEMKRLRERHLMMLHGSFFTYSFFQYKATVFVFFNMLVFIVQTIINACILYYFYTNNFTTATNRLYSDVQWLALCISCCFLDVFWFQECRFLLVKMLSCCCKSLTKYVEEVRVKVYDINTIIELTP